ncbi:MAG: ComEC/Rec2 family competence protein [Candidatus Paceibacterota bacterium]|jgi:competence protein ComEC
MKNSFLYAGLGGFVGGIFVHSFLNVSIWFAIFMGVISLALASVVFVIGGNKSSKIILVLVGIFFFGCGLVRFNISNQGIYNPVLSEAVGTTVIISGVVGQEPDVRDTQTRLVVSTKSVSDGNAEKGAAGKILVTTNNFPEYAYGDKIEVRGKLQLPKNRLNGEREFDYVSFLKKDGIGYEMFLPKVRIISHDNGNALVAQLLAVKHFFIRGIENALPEPESALLSGLLLGGKNSLGTTITEDFRRAGIIHIVVLSGYNITIVAEAIIKMVSFAPRFVGFTCGGVGIVLFALMTGAGATVVRASVMALLAVLARATGRVYDMTRALLLAGVLMLVQNPKILVFDSSFQLSFLATLGLIIFSPRLEKKFSRLPQVMGLRGVVTSTIATQLCVLPLLLYKTGLFSVVSFVSNIVVLPLIPLTMFVGFIAAVGGCISSVAAFVPGLCAFVLLAFILKASHGLASIPWAAFTIPFPIWLSLGLYIIYAIVLQRNVFRRLTSLGLQKVRQYILIFLPVRNQE